MRTPSLRSLAFACLASGALLTAGCNRNNDATPTDDITTAEDRSEDNIETAISSDAYQVSTPQNVDNAAAGFTTTDPEFQARFGPCVTRTYTAQNRTLIIDFHAGCLCADGRFRSGQIVVQFTTDVNRRIAGAVVRRRNYFVNYNQHIARRTFTDLGGGSFNIAVDSASIIRANNGGTHSWTANWTFAPTANTTATVREYRVTGMAAGTNRKGVSYTTTVQTPLIKSSTCFKYFTAGTINITNSNNKTMTLDYGNGTCDNVATVTVNGHTKTIALR
ncbi:MAG: hypothetical protein JWP58_4369 [Hymenobacter sp.]|nr:hypothetical protein [Hymenobacter sp.]